MVSAISIMKITSHDKISIPRFIFLFLSSFFTLLEIFVNFAMIGCLGVQDVTKLTRLSIMNLLLAYSFHLETNFYYYLMSK